VVSTLIEVQALIRILERKGVITQDDILKEVGVLRKVMEKKISRGRIRLILSRKTVNVHNLNYNNMIISILQ